MLSYSPGKEQKTLSVVLKRDGLIEEGPSEGWLPVIGDRVEGDKRTASKHTDARYPESCL